MNVIGLKTYMSDSGAREFLLLDVQEYCGENVLSNAPHPYQSPVERTIRSLYHIKSDSIVLQIPRQSNEFPGIDKQGELYSVNNEGDYLYFHYLYGQNHEEGITARWDMQNDSWEISEELFRTEYNEEKVEDSIWNQKTLTV